MKPTAPSISLTLPHARPITPGRVVLGLLVVLLGLVGASGLAATAGGRAGSTTAAVFATGGVTTGAVSAASRAALPAATPQRLGAFSTFAGQPAHSTAKTAEAGPSPASVTAGQSAKIEETGGITLVIPAAHIGPDLSRVATLAVGNGGFVASTQTQSAAPGAPAQGTITVQVPEGNFNAVLAQVRGLGHVASLTTSATDVTGQYVDLQARINALEDSREQYLTIMTKATTVGGILAVQAQLQSLQSQLEQLQGQLQLLNNETTYSTLAVTFTQKVVTPPPPHPESGLLKAWHAAVGGFVAGFEGVVRVAGPLFFALLLLVALVLVGRWAWKYRPRHPNRTAPGPE
jgi:hypothetical protein